MSYTIIKNYVDKSKYKIKCPHKMKPKYITVHNTDNDASAENEVAYMRRNNLQTSFHVAVDDKEVVYGIPFDRNAWHAGDGGSGTGNRQSIGVEICYSKSGGARFDKAEKNAAKWIAKELKVRGWGIDRVKRHKDWSGKNCPKRTMSRGWQRFLDMIKTEMRGTVSSKPTKPSKPTIEEDGYWGVDCTKATQKFLGTPVDGEVDGQYSPNKKYLPNATSGWHFASKAKGSTMIKALQRLVGVKADGIAGKGTVVALQKFLKKKSYKLTVDGIMGKSTVKAWQDYLNKHL